MYQLSEDVSEGEDIVLQSPQPQLDIDSNENVEDESEVEEGSEEEGGHAFFPTPFFV